MDRTTPHDVAEAADQATAAAETALEVWQDDATRTTHPDDAVLYAVFRALLAEQHATRVLLADLLAGKSFRVSG